MKITWIIIVVILLISVQESDTFGAKKYLIKAWAAYFIGVFDVFLAWKMGLKSTLYFLLFILKAVKQGIFCTLFLRSGDSFGALPPGMEDLHHSVQYAVKGMDAFNNSISSIGVDPNRFIHWTPDYRDSIENLNDQVMINMVRDIIQGAINILEGRLLESTSVDDYMSYSPGVNSLSNLMR